MYHRFFFSIVRTIIVPGFISGYNFSDIVTGEVVDISYYHYSVEPVERKKNIDTKLFLQSNVNNVRGSRVKYARKTVV